MKHCLYLFIYCIARSVIIRALRFAFARHFRLVILLYRPRAVTVRYLRFYFVYNLVETAV